MACDAVLGVLCLKLCQLMPSPSSLHVCACVFVWVFCICTHLYDLRGRLWRAVPQVMPIDGQHFVVVPQLAVFSRQPPHQQVQDEDARLVRLADQLDAQRLRALPLHQGDLGDRALDRVGRVVRVVRVRVVVMVVGGLS